MKLIIDCREADLIKQIKQQILFNAAFKKIVVETSNLPLGDIIIQRDDGTSEIIIERKSIPDLLSSIKDGRYEEQSYRLSGIEHPNHNIIYIVEGDSNNKKFFSRTDKLTYYSTLLSLNYYKGFSVMRTQNLTETAVFLCNSLIKIQKNISLAKLPYHTTNNKHIDNKPIDTTCEIKSKDTSSYDLSGGETLEVTSICEEGDHSSEKDYIHVVKKVKKENITPGNIDEIMLCQIPHISSIISIAIINKFKSIKNMMEEHNKYVESTENEDPTEIIKVLFNDISYINSKGDKRKITKTAMNNLYKYLLVDK